MDPVVPLLRALSQRNVRYVAIGAGGVNLWAHSGGVVFKTDDRDLFLPPDTLDRPRDRWLAEHIVARRASTRATGPDELLSDRALARRAF